MAWDACPCTRLLVSLLPGCLHACRSPPADLPTGWLADAVRCRLLLVGRQYFLPFKEAHLGSVVGLLLTHASPQLRKLGVDLLIDFIKCQVGGWLGAVRCGAEEWAPMLLFCQLKNPSEAHSCSLPAGPYLVAHSLLGLSSSLVPSLWLQQTSDYVPQLEAFVPLLCANASPHVTVTAVGGAAAGSPAAAAAAVAGEQWGALRAACLRALLEHLRFCARLSYVSYHLHTVTFAVLESVEASGQGAPQARVLPQLPHSLPLAEAVSYLAVALPTMPPRVFFLPGCLPACRACTCPRARRCSRGAASLPPTFRPWLPASAESASAARWRPPRQTSRRCLCLRSWRT